MSLHSDAVNQSVTFNGSVAVLFYDVALNHRMIFVVLSLGKERNYVVTAFAEPFVIIVVIKLGQY